MKKICVLGLGYIGLPTVAVLATHGFTVLGVDTNEAVVDVLNGGEVHIEEPGLRTLMQAAVESGNLLANAKPEEAEIFVIAVPTPRRDNEADLSFVESASESIVPYLKQGNLVILESTVPPRTTTDLVRPILERSGLKAGADFHLAHCPERVLPGNILREIVENDRIIGGLTPECARKAQELYTKFVTGRSWLTDATSAEMAKLVENTFRDVNIAFANELSRVCHRLGLDVWEVIELANRHPRVNVLKPGPGVGGHCIAVDPWFIAEKAPEEAKLIRQSREVNDAQPQYVVELVREMLRGVARPKVTVLGVAYKANVDDTRESPALKIVQRLSEAGYELGIVDPHVRAFPWTLCTMEEGASGSDLLVLLTDHEEFKCLSPETLAPLMRTRQVLDTRGGGDFAGWREAGFVCRRLGDGRSM